MKKLGCIFFLLATFLSLSHPDPLVGQSTGKKDKAVQQAPANLAPIYKLIPAKDKTEAEQIGKLLVAGGPAIVEQLLGEVGEKFGDKKGVQATYALHALVVYAGRPKADAERQMVAETLAKQLEAKHSNDVKALIISQLQLCGRDKEIPAIAKYLSDERLCEPATQALLAIRGEAALSALREALPKAEGKRQATIKQAVEILSKNKK